MVNVDGGSRWTEHESNGHLMDPAKTSLRSGCILWKLEWKGRCDICSEGKRRKVEVKEHGRVRGIGIDQTRLRHGLPWWSERIRHDTLIDHHCHRQGEIRKWLGRHIPFEAVYRRPKWRGGRKKRGGNWWVERNGVAKQYVKDGKRTDITALCIFSWKSQDFQNWHVTLSKMKLLH